MKGFETFFEATKSKLKTKTDLIVATVHFMLVHEYDFACVGVGEQFSSENEPRSELLPHGWNDSSTDYAIRYESSRADSTRVLLKCVMASDNFIVTVFPVQPDSNELYSATIKLDDYVTNGSLQDRPHSQVFVGGSESKLETMLKKAFGEIRKPKKTQQTQTSSSASNNAYRPSNLMEPNQPQYIVPPRFGGYPVNPYANPYPSPFVPQFPPQIGRGDLNPFGQNQGGGMLFNPFQGARNRPPMNPHLPPGAVPPGARFDPFGPPGTGGRFARPDNDHELPPPGADDMFM